MMCACAQPLAALGNCCACRHARVLRLALAARRPAAAVPDLARTQVAVPKASAVQRVDLGRGAGCRRRAGSWVTGMRCYRACSAGAGAALGGGLAGRAQA